jgi:phosphomannomutase
MTLRAVAERWLNAEPDADMRHEIASLLAGPDDQLASRFTGRLQFGTAGLRAAVGAGPQRMNRLVVRQAAAGLVDYLLVNEPDAARRGVVIGFDARRKSDLFALDTARVCAARGVRALLFEEVVPTPCLAWSITGVGAAAGVMVTASHNPAADNGYKVYLDIGAQILPPYDSAIAACIDEVDPTNVELADANHPLIERLGVNYWSTYVRSTPSVRLQPDCSDVVVAYSAMHGVGGDTLLAAFAEAGLPEPHVVDAQQRPDASFPTVPFPNPEEPSAMDLLMARAAEVGAHVALANDPDADRLGVAIPLADGSWRRLGGDEIGWLLADHILQRTAHGDESHRRLVVTTVVSSSMLAKMAKAYGVEVRETFTGFKWIGHVAASLPELRFVFGYEQALGYAVSARPLDKDGITAAIMMAEVAACAVRDGVTVQRRLDDLVERFGRHVMAEMSLRMDPATGSAAVAALRANPPTHVADQAVTAVTWFDEAGLLRLQLGDAVRLQVRPSGTEPKVKLYGEGIDTDTAPLLSALARLLSV